MITRRILTVGLFLKKFKVKKPLLFTIWCLVLIFLFVFGGVFFGWKNGLLAVNSANTTKSTFVIGKGDTVEEIAARLEDAGLIKSAFLFKINIFFSGIARKIQAGSYQLSPSMTADEIGKALIKGTNDQWVTIIEGLRQEEIGELLIKSGFAINPKEWQQTIEKQKLEGQLFPDTYLFPKGADQEMVLTIIGKNFDKKVVTGLKDEIAQSNMTLNEILTMASIVEREARGDRDRQIVAGILLKRLDNNWPLQTDATIQYAVAGKRCKNTYDANCDWWPHALTQTDLAVKSVYNTYTNRELPPTPICNPSLSAIEAVLNPQKTIYWFYLSDMDGVIHYAKTDADHATNIQKYLR